MTSHHGLSPRPLRGMRENVVRCSPAAWCDNERDPLVAVEAGEGHPQPLDLGVDLQLGADLSRDGLLRALVAGGRYRLVPQPMYFYRKHGTSISHRSTAWRTRSSRI